MAHIHEKIDFTASAYVVFDNKVLLHVHKKTGNWLPPGGHIELDEDPNQAVLREVKEEAGIDIEIDGEADDKHSWPGEVELIPPRFMNRHHFDTTHEHIDLVYFARAKSADFTPEEGAGEMRWFSKEDLDRQTDIMPRVRSYALAALKEIAE